MRWIEFQENAPEIAGIGHQLLYNAEGGEVGILASVDASGRAGVAPVCPIFSGRGLYLLAGAKTPKTRHLRRHGGFALHAQVGADDLEFQISGVVREVLDAAEKAAVIRDIPFPSFDPADPLFELLIERALSVSWEEPGVPCKRVFP